MSKEKIVLIRKEKDIVISGTDEKVGSYMNGGVVFTKDIQGCIEMKLEKKGEEHD